MVGPTFSGSAGTDRRAAVRAAVRVRKRSTGLLGNSAATLTLNVGSR